MMNRVIALAVFLTFSHPIWIEGSNFACSIQSDSDVFVRDVLEVPNGGFLCAVNAGDGGLAKLDRSGNIAWIRRYSGPGNGLLVLDRTVDGGYILGGLRMMYPDPYDAWIIRTDAKCRTLWEKAYGGRRTEWVDTVKQTSDGGYIMGGFTTSFGHGNDAWIVKLDSTGHVTWERVFGAREREFCVATWEHPEGGYIAVSFVGSTGHGDVNVMKLDTAGNAVWQKNYGSPRAERPCSAAATFDGGCIICGVTAGYGSEKDAWVFKLGPDGQIEWQKRYGGAGTDLADSVRQTTDGGYVVCGSTLGDNAADSSAWMLRLDKQGEIASQKSFVCAGYYGRLTFIMETSRQGIIAAGYLESQLPPWGFDSLVLSLSGNLTMPAIDCPYLASTSVVAKETESISSPSTWILRSTHCEVNETMTPATETSFAVIGFCQ
ncbi:MAG: hypothetical protein AB1714_19700 [Acidobacteriota bacterium]